jgi:hypothetical protein
MKELLLELLEGIAGLVLTVLFYGAVIGFLWLVFQVPVALDPWERLMALFAVFFLGLIVWAGITDHELLEERGHALPIGVIWIVVSVYSIGIDPLGPVMGPIASL